MLTPIIALLYVSDFALCAYGLYQASLHHASPYDHIAMPLSLVLLILAMSLTYVCNTRERQGKI